MHDVHGVDHLTHDRQVVGDEEQAQAEIVAQRPEQLQDLRLHRHVEGRHRLVADEQLRIDRQRPGDGDALAFAAGQRVGPASLVGRRQADQIEQLAGSALGVVTAHADVAQRLGEGVPDALARVERREGVLEHDLDDASGPRIARPDAGAVAVLEVDGAARHLLEAGDAPPERRLAGAGFTDQADRLAAPDGERHAAQGRDGAALADPERLVHVVDCGDRLFHHLDAGRADGDLADHRSLTRSRHVLFDVGDPHAPALAARRQRRQRRSGRTADVLRPLATRRERALAGDVVGPGDRSFDRLQLRLALSGGRLRQQQSERVGVGRRPLDVTGVARLEHRAGVQHVDAVAHREGDAAGRA